MKFKNFFAILAFFIASLTSANSFSLQTIDMIFSNEAYQIWLNQSPQRIDAKNKFERFLLRNQVFGVLPTYQILRSASMAKECNESAFDIPPNKYWPNIVKTLKFIKTYIEPEIGELEAVSGYRNPVLNQCAGGAKNSAHAKYFALDLIPITDIKREELIGRVCQIHTKFGKNFDIGLGFYSYTRFHIDAKSYRRWGKDGRGKTSPCAQYDRFVTSDNKEANK